MKFYQTVASLIFYIAYTTTIFGSEETVDVPRDILDLIDQFRDDKNKTYYKEVGHQKIRNDEKEGTEQMTVLWDLNSVEFVYSYFDDRKNFTSDCLSLSDMKNVGKELNDAQKELISCVRFRRSLDDLSKSDNIRFRTNKGKKLRYDFKDGKVDIFLSHGTSTYDYICSLEVPKKITDWDISPNGKTIVTCDGGHIRKWELQEYFAKGFKMSDVYPGGRIIVPAVKHGIRKAVQMIAIAGIGITFFKVFFN